MNSRTALGRMQHLVGRCFDIEDPTLSKSWGASHVTVVSCPAQRDEQFVSLHLDNGSIDTRVTLEAFWAAYENGLLLESATMAPFTNPPSPRSKHWNSAGVSTRGGIRTHADVLRSRR